MKINKIQFKNIASYGNEIQELDFSKNKTGNLHLVLGVNGMGKSTIAKAMVYALYGQVDNYNLSDLPNRINKNLWVKIEVNCNGNKIVIERGIAPKIFKVKINGVPEDQAGLKNIQKRLEEEYYGIPYKVFKNIIILSINEFKSFVDMTPKDKRNIIDKLFGFSIINDMFDYVKSERKELKKDIELVTRELESITSSVDSANKSLEELEALAEDENNKKIAELKANLQTINEDKKKLDLAKTKLSNEVVKIDDALTKAQRFYNTKSEEERGLDRRLKLYENSQCPTCGSSLETDLHKGIKEELQTKKDKLSAGITKLHTQIDKLRKKSTTNKEKQHKIISRASSINTQIGSIKIQMTELANTIKNGSSNQKQFKKLIADFRKRELSATKNQNSLTQNDYFYSLMESLLGDGGIKEMATAAILPTLNSNIALMLNEMHIKFQVKFDEKFNCIVTDLGEEINPKTMSTGEKKKVDFITIIAYIKLLVTRYPQLNVLFLDEIFSSVDPDGVYNILKILNSIIKEHSINTFVINHTILPQEIFDKKVELYKDNGFSKFRVEDIR